MGVDDGRLECVDADGILREGEVGKGQGKVEDGQSREERRD